MLEIVKKKIIAHSLHTYLFRTGSWIYSQMVNVKKFHSLVVAARKQNLDVFPWDDAYFLSDLSGLNRFGPDFWAPFPG